MSITNDTVSNKDNKSISSQPVSKNNTLESITKKDKLLDTKKVEWSPENEVIMVEWCDVAQCYKWLNTRSHAKYSFMNAWFTIPAITLSTISGTASFAQTSLPEKYQTYAPMAIGTINILIGILTTVQQYLKISELNEAHRVAAIAWDKFARNIRIELAKKPKERMEAGSFIKLSRQEFDRLMETSPGIDLNIIRCFDNTFKGKDGSPERKIYDALQKPDICNSIKTSNDIRHKWYTDLEDEYDVIDVSTDDAVKLKDDLIKAQQTQLEQTLLDIKRRDDEVSKKLCNELVIIQQKEMDSVNYFTDRSKLIDEFIQKFKFIYNRKPNSDEIKLGLVDTVELDIIQRYLVSYTDNNV